MNSDSSGSMTGRLSNSALRFLHDPIRQLVRIVAGRSGAHVSQDGSAPFDAGAESSGNIVRLQLRDHGFHDFVPLCNRNLRPDAQIRQYIHAPLQERYHEQDNGTFTGLRNSMMRKSPLGSELQFAAQAV